RDEPAVRAADHDEALDAEVLADGVDVRDPLLVRVGSLRLRPAAAAGVEGDDPVLAGELGQRAARLGVARHAGGAVVRDDRQAGAVALHVHEEPGAVDLDERRLCVRSHAFAQMSSRSRRNRMTVAIQASCSSNCGEWPEFSKTTSSLSGSRRCSSSLASTGVIQSWRPTVMSTGTSI